jgi:hypothetical protein
MIFIAAWLNAFDERQDTNASSFPIYRENGSSAVMNPLSKTIQQSQRGNVTSYFIQEQRIFVSRSNNSAP